MIRTEDKQVTHTHKVRIIQCDACGHESEVVPPEMAMGIIPMTQERASGFIQRAEFLSGSSSRHFCDACTPGVIAAIEAFCSAHRPPTPTVKPTMPTPEGTH